MFWMKDDRVKLYVLGEKAKTSGIWNGEPHKYAYNLKASKLTFTNVFMCKKVTMEQFDKPHGYHMNFLKVLITT